MSHILVVDDERDVVTLIKFLLEKDGHQVSTAYNGREALERLGVEPAAPDAPIPDLMIMDVLMPIMDGFTTASRLAADAKARAVPILILTAKGQTKDLFRMSPNVAAHLEKPFDPKELRKLVNSMLGKK